MTRCHAPNLSGWIRAQYWKYLPTHHAPSIAIEGDRSTPLAFRSLNPDSDFGPVFPSVGSNNSIPTRSLPPSLRLDPNQIDALMLDPEVQDELAFYSQNSPLPCTTNPPHRDNFNGIEIELELLATVQAIQASVTQALNAPGLNVPSPAFSPPVVQPNAC